MKVEVKNHNKPRVVKPKDMSYSQIGYIKDYQAYEGILVIRAYKSLFAIDKDGLRWDWMLSDSQVPTFDIELLPPGTVVTITV
jgi:hypothetical protein